LIWWEESHNFIFWNLHERKATHNQAIWEATHKESCHNKLVENAQSKKSLRRTTEKGRKGALALEAAHCECQVIFSNNLVESYF